MSDRMKEETIALVAVDKTIRSLGEALRTNYQSPPKSIGQIAEEALAEVEEECRKGRLGFLNRSFSVDPETKASDPLPTRRCDQVGFHRGHEFWDFETSEHRRFLKYWCHGRKVRKP